MTVSPMARCFGATHWIVVATCGVAGVCQAVVAWRTRALYRQIWQHERAAAAR